MTPPLGRRAATILAAVALALVLVAPRTAAAADLPALFQASYDHELSEDYAGALAPMDEAAAAAPSYIVHLRRGWLLYLLGRYADAVVAYEQAVLLEPTSVEARQGLVLPLMALKRWHEAQTACEALLRIAPTDYRGTSRLAYVLYNQGQYARSAERYRAVLEHYPSDVELRAGLGWALLKDGQLPEARATFAAVLEVAPNHVSALQGQEAAR